LFPPLLALPVRANIPIGAAMTFLSNPVTTPFIILASVWLGDWLFGLQANSATFSAMIEHGVRHAFRAAGHLAGFGSGRICARLDFLGQLDSPPLAA